jgi:hypothetical protein
MTNFQKFDNKQLLQIVKLTRNVSNLDLFFHNILDEVSHRAQLQCPFDVLTILESLSTCRHGFPKATIVMLRKFPNNLELQERRICI